MGNHENADDNTKREKEREKEGKTEKSIQHVSHGIFKVASNIIFPHIISSHGTDM